MSFAFQAAESGLEHGDCKMVEKYTVSVFMPLKVILKNLFALVRWLEGEPDIMSSYWCCKSLECMLFPVLS